VAQFSPQTGVRPVEFEELQAVFRDYYGEDEEARVPLWTLYEGLLAFLLAVRPPAPGGPLLGPLIGPLLGLLLREIVTLVGRGLLALLLAVRPPAPGGPLLSGCVVSPWLEGPCWHSCWRRACRRLEVRSR